MIVKVGAAGSTPKFATTVSLPFHQLVAVMHAERTTVDPQTEFIGDYKIRHSQRKKTRSDQGHIATAYDSVKDDDTTPN